MTSKKTKTDDDGVAEHLPSCSGRCVAACGVSPRRAFTDPHRPHPPRVRALHVEPVAEEERYPRPLWEHVDDPAGVTWHRNQGCEVRRRGAEPRALVGLPLPPTDGPEEHAIYNLGRWTADDGPEALRLEQEIHDANRARRARILETNEERRIARVGAIVRAAFPGITAEPLPAPARPPVVVRGSERMAALLRLAIGEPQETPAAAPYVPMHEATEHLRQVFTGLVWGLALALFGRERDPVSDYAFGRLLPGAPIRDRRPPFASASHVLSVASAPLPSLGAGSMSLEIAQPVARTWAHWDECKVTPSHAGTDHVRGEMAVNRVLDARAAMRRADLTASERAAVEVLGSRLPPGEKAMQLREIEARRIGVRWEAFLPEELKRRASAEFDARGAVCDEYSRALRSAPDDATYARLEAEFRARSAIWVSEEQEMNVLVESAKVHALRKATDHVSDAALFRAARAASDRLEAAVQRESRTGDALAPKREPKRRLAPHHRPRPAPVRAELVAGDA